MNDRKIRYHSFMLRIILVSLVFAGVVSAQDSPLVALAKKSNRKASKTPVITHQTLANRDRIAVPAAEPAPAAEPTPATAAHPAVAPAPATAATPATAPAKPAAPAGARVAVAAVPSNYSGTTVRNIEPSSSAQVIAAQSTAATTPLTSGAGRFEPQATGRAVQPASTARSVQPQAGNKPAQ
jgi:hypothetical protein